MKKLTTLFLTVFLISQSVISQSQSNVITENRTDKHFYFAIGFGEGFFYPGDVNDYIEHHIQDIEVTSGVENLFLNIVGRASLIYQINKTIDISLIGEYAWGPKLIAVTNGENKYFHFDRATTGITAKFHIPVKSGKNSMFFTPGLLYNFMKFEEYKANALGARFGAGFSFNFKKFKLQPFACFDYTKAIDDGFELNYTGGQIGVDFVF